MQRSRRYLRTDEQDDAVRSLEWATVLCDRVEAEPYTWKWQLLALHSAVQGFMVLALEKGNGLLALTPKAAAKWSAAHRLRGTAKELPYPPPRMDEFPNLYKKVKDGSNFNHPFQPLVTRDKSVRLLAELRNEFVHFTPKGWSLEFALLPPLLADAADLVEWCASPSAGVLWHKPTQLRRTKSALRKLRRAANRLRLTYGA